MYDNGEKICCICGKAFVGWGNNPYPVNENEDARCCDECNSKYVIPARIAGLNTPTVKGEG